MKEHRVDRPDKTSIIGCIETYPMIGISERGKLGTRRRLQASDVVDGNTFARGQ